MTILIGYILTYGWVFAILFLSDFIRKKMNLSKEFSRKFVHIFVAFSWIPMVYCFSNTWHLLIPPLSFVILNYISYKKETFAMIEREQNKSYGTIFYPLSMLIMSIISLVDQRFLIPYGIGLFCMALGDGFAAFFGKKIPSLSILILKGNKTLSGSMTVFIISLSVLSVFAMFLSFPLSLIEIFIISIVGTFLEIIGIKGLDNLFLPLGVAGLSFLFILI